MTVAVVPSNVAALYARAAETVAAPPAGSAGGGFAQLVRDAAENAVGALKTGEAVSLQAAAGKADLSVVAQAMANAQIALETVTAVRDKVISAYQEVSQMPI